MRARLVADFLPERRQRIADKCQPAEVQGVQVPDGVHAGDGRLDDGPLRVVDLKGDPQRWQRRQNVAAQQNKQVSTAFRQKSASAHSSVASRTGQQVM